MLPILVPQNLEKEWQQEDDLELLNEIISQDISEPIDLDFDEISSQLNKTSEGCKRRWEILLKGLGGVPPGKKINVQKVAAQMIDDINTKHERYIPFVGKQSSRNGSNTFINILDYYRKNFA